MISKLRIALISTALVIGFSLKAQEVEMITQGMITSDFIIENDTLFHTRPIVGFGQHNYIFEIDNTRFIVIIKRFSSRPVKKGMNRNEKIEAYLWEDGHFRQVESHIKTSFSEEIGEWRKIQGEVDGRFRIDVKFLKAKSKAYSADLEFQHFIKKYDLTTAFVRYR